MDPMIVVNEEMHISKDNNQQLLIKHAINYVKSYLISPILDLGAGDGWTTNYINTELNLSAISVSINKIDCDNAKKLYNIDMINNDMENLIDCSSDYYNTIWCRQAIEHSQSPFKALKEMNRILKKDGTVILIVPYPLDILIFAESHLYCLDDKQWRNLFIKTGFNVINKHDQFMLNGYAEVMYILKKVTN